MMGNITQHEADERALFEQEANDARFFPREIDFSLTKSPSGRDEYANSHLQSRWEGWQAGRASLTPAAPQAASQQAVVDNAEQIQWRNIQKVVREVAKFCFGAADDKVYGTFYTAVVTCLTAKDGVHVELESLRAPQAATTASESEEPACHRCGMTGWHVCRANPEGHAEAIAQMDEVLGHTPAPSREAARYHYLRSQDDGIEFRDGEGRWRSDCPSGEKLDKIIDAALARAPLPAQPNSNKEES